MRTIFVQDRQSMVRANMRFAHDLIDAQIRMINRIAKVSKIASVDRLGERGVGAPDPKGGNIASELTINSIDAFKKEILTPHPASAFIETGVKEHAVYPNMVGVTGTPFQVWMEGHGFAEGLSNEKKKPHMVVGRNTPQSRLNKQNPVAFMKKGYNVAYKAATKKGGIIETELNKL